jgi:hypothetical protein
MHRFGQMLVLVTYILITYLIIITWSSLWALVMFRKELIFLILCLTKLNGKHYATAFS